jgi:hypothetical protein
LHLSDINNQTTHTADRFLRVNLRTAVDALLSCISEANIIDFELESNDTSTLDTEMEAKPE